MVITQTKNIKQNSLIDFDYNSDKIDIYDIEQFPNFHSYVGVDLKTKKIKKFVISEWRNDIKEYLEHLQYLKYQVGYNNLNYDYKLIHHIILYRKSFLNMDPLQINAILYTLSKEIINNINLQKIKNYYIEQIDLYRIWHFDNKAKATSLKHIEVALEMTNVDDLNLDFDKKINEKDIEKILNYNVNDVLATYNFFKLTIGDTEHPLYKNGDKIELRKILSKKYNINLINSNDPQIGSEILLDYYSKRKKLNKNYLRLNSQTERDVVNLKDCILENITFENPNFKYLVNKLKSKKISETKNSIKEVINYKNVDFHYGAGGLHGCNSPGIYNSDDQYMILDIDVTSFYPRLIVGNKYYPEKLGLEFCEIINDLFEERQKYPKNSPENTGLKLSINGVCGKLKDEYCWFKDKKTFLQITINGQLLITKLAEMIFNKVDGKLIQVNTDGITLKIKKTDYDLVIEICKNWEKTFNLNLEYFQYKKIIVKDVNNYIAIYNDDKVKTKGVFEINKEIHKNPSLKIVKKAIYDYYINNIPILTTIKNCNDILSFCSYVRAKKNNNGEIKLINRFVTIDNVFLDTELPNTVRYYISNSNNTLMKILPPDPTKIYSRQYDIFNNISNEREVNVEAGYKVTIYNKHVKLPIKMYNINYDYYINECNKILDSITNKQY